MLSKLYIGLCVIGGVFLLSLCFCGYDCEFVSHPTSVVGYLSDYFEKFFEFGGWVNLDTFTVLVGIVGMCIWVCTATYPETPSLNDPIIMQNPLAWVTSKLSTSEKSIVSFGSQFFWSQQVFYWCDQQIFPVRYFGMIWGNFVETWLDCAVILAVCFNYSRISVAAWCGQQIGCGTIYLETFIVVWLFQRCVFFYVNVVVGINAENLYVSNGFVSMVEFSWYFSSVCGLRFVTGFGKRSSKAEFEKRRWEWYGFETRPVKLFTIIFVVVHYVLGVYKVFFCGNDDMMKEGIEKTMQVAVGFFVPEKVMVVIDSVSNRQWIWARDAKEANEIGNEKCGGCGSVLVGLFAIIDVLDMFLVFLSTYTVLFGVEGFPVFVVMVTEVADLVCDGLVASSLGLKSMKGEQLLQA